MDPTRPTFKDHTCILEPGATALVAVNRHLLAAIKTPPDVGNEKVLDALAATIWARRSETDIQPDVGFLCRFDRHLQCLEADAPQRRAHHLSKARAHLRAYQAELDAGV